MTLYNFPMNSYDPVHIFQCTLMTLYNSSVKSDDPAQFTNEIW